MLGLAIGFVGRPIVIKDLPTEAAATDGANSDSTEVAQAIQERGMIVRPEDAEEFAKSLLFLAKNPEERKKLGNAGRTYAAEKLSKEKILFQFEKDLCSLVNGSKVNSNDRL